MNRSCSAHDRWESCASFFFALFPVFIFILNCDSLSDVYAWITERTLHAAKVSTTTTMFCMILMIFPEVGLATSFMAGSYMLFVLVTDIINRPSGRF